MPLQTIARGLFLLLAVLLLLTAPALVDKGVSAQEASFFGKIKSSLTGNRPALPDENNVREGDVIFQESQLSRQSLAIKLATGSRYSHCGIIFKKNGRPYVYEAIRTVSWTPLEEWVKRGVGGHYLLTRLGDADAVLTPELLQNMQKTAAGFKGLDYDLAFEWSDERIYCSELVWKIYERAAGIKLGNLRPLSDYRLDHPEVRKKMLERYGENPPLGQMVISPSDILDSGLLKVVQKN